MKNYFTLLLLMFITFTSCKEKVSSVNDTKIEAKENPVAVYTDLVENYMDWWTYHYHSINLSLDFTPINENSKLITKGKFLEALTTGNYITIELESKADTVKYKLFKLGEEVNQSIVSTIKNTSVTVLKHYKMEGTAFPEFNVTDINGVKYTNETIKGKTMVLKTWFIACKPCVAEFPELNELVEKYKENDTVIFTSLALDTKPKLDVFLTKNPFAYSVVAEQNNFIQEQLNLQAFPTHVVVNENGIIIKVVNKASELITFLETNKTLKAKPEKMSPPPPPAGPQGS